MGSRTSKKPPDIKAPGLNWRKRATGWCPYWLPFDKAVKAGYPTKSANLGLIPDEELYARCLALQAQALEWMATEGKARAPRVDGTVGSLIRHYQTDDASPYRSLRQASHAYYDHNMELVFKAAGSRKIASLSGEDFRRWHLAFKAPREEGGEPRLRRAQACLAMVRVLMNYGSTLADRAIADECLRLSGVLSNIRFETPAPRTQRLTYDQAHAIIMAARKHGTLAAVGIAIGQALQFDTGMRPIDLIGTFERPSGIVPDNAIMRAGKIWVRGLTWEMIKPDWTVTFERTSKTGKYLSFNLAKDMPLAFAELTRIPVEDRVGPVVCMQRGEPFKQAYYSHLWRKIAREAGVPDDLLNRDSRSGATTEALEAGADLADVQRMLGHTKPSMTSIYDRTTEAKVARVSQFRTAARQKSGKNDS